MSSIAYRPDIDGLRAIAVLIVVLCHAAVPGFSGGYVGVDVFFVISGFLITSLIFKDLQNGTFSFVAFWERRCRRILPPLAVVMIATMMAGWFLYFPADFESLGKQLATQAVFASNILFKMQEGYFNVANQTKPLLHTWSLSVEEQFYLFFPVAAFLMWKYRREKIAKYIVVCAVITFIGAAFIVRNSPTSAFYLLPFRAWELLLGSWLAIRGPQFNLKARTREILGLAGLLGIFLPVFFYNDDTLFPGALAIPPCFGAAAIILANMQGPTITGHILSVRPMVFIGLISYSLYLWHWPILAYVRYGSIYPFTPVMAFSCILLAVVLAILTWHFVEKPVRRKVVFRTTKRLYAAAFILLLTAASVGLLIVHYKGTPERLSPDILSLAEGATDINPHREACNKPKLSRFDDGTICQFNGDKNIKPSFILWGDSLADAVAPAFYNLAQTHNKNGYVVTAHGCPPILGYAQKKDVGFDCPGFNSRVLKLIEDNNIKNVFYVGNWTDHLNPDQDNYSFADMDWYKPYETRYPHVTDGAIQYTIDELQKRGIRVYMLLDYPSMPFDPPRYLPLKRLYNADHLPEDAAVEPYNEARGRTEKFVAQNQDRGIIFLDPRPYFCDASRCKAMKDDRSFYYDPGHLSAFGAHQLEGLFEPYFKKP